MLRAKNHAFEILKGLEVKLKDLDEVPHSNKTVNEIYLKAIDEMRKNIVPIWRSLVRIPSVPSRRLSKDIVVGDITSYIRYITAGWRYAPLIKEGI